MECSRQHLSFRLRPKSEISSWLGGSPEVRGNGLVPGHRRPCAETDCVSVGDLCVRCRDERFGIHMVVTKDCNIEPTILKPLLPGPPKRFPNFRKPPF